MRASSLKYYAHHRNPVAKAAFNSASKQYKRCNRELYARYLRQTQTNLRRNPKNFWAFVNEKRKEGGIPKTMFLGNETSDSAATQCELFAKHFSSVFSSDIINSPQIDEALATVPEGSMPVPTPVYTKDQVRLAINRLKPSSSPGPDGIPPIVLKKCADVLCEPLSIIFNRSLSSAQFPTSWKKSVLFPAFKKGNKANIANYRGLTSLCAGSKLMEILISQSITVKAKPYISSDQHGFYSGRSITTNLLQFTSDCIKSIEEGYQIDTVYTDLKAAFDRVNHKLLVAKLLKLGVARNLASWLESNLSERPLLVKLGDNESTEFNNTSGVPQGSNLGPLLFAIFFNDVMLALPEKCRSAYADDLKVFAKIKSETDCHLLQNYVNIFKQWCTKNFLSISVEKCAIISFTRKTHPILHTYKIDDTPLARVSVFKDLGVLLDSKLTFQEHYSYIIAKANRNLGFISRISREFRDPHCLRSLYCSLVRSSLEFASVIWSPYATCWSKRIEAIQSKFVKRALRFLPWSRPQELTEYKHRCQLLGLETLLERRIAARAILVKKILDNEIDSPALLYRMCINVRPRTLRHHEFLRISFQRTNYGLNEPIRIMCRVFNWFYDLC